MSGPGVQSAGLVQDLVDEFGYNGPVTVKRLAPDTYADGELVKGAPEPDLVVTASVQPITGNEKLQVPEADRERDNVWLFTQVELQRNDQVTIPTIPGTWEVHAAENWGDKCLGHFESRAVKIDGS